MKVSELTLISGSDIRIADGVTIRQPRLRAICAQDIGEERYSLFVGLFNLTPTDLLGKDNPIVPKEIVEHMHTFDLLTGFEDQRNMLTDALRFFLGEEVEYVPADRCYRTESDGIITRETFDDMTPVIMQINCVKQRRETAKTFANAKAQKIFEKIQKAREEQKRGSADPNFTLSNIISKLSSKHPSLNLLNVWDLTIYQLYDQFACVCTNNQLDVVGLRWAAWGKEDFDFTQWYKHHAK